MRLLVFSVSALDLSSKICLQPCKVPAKFAEDFNFSGLERRFG